ncbi:MAG: flavodoxin family protein [Anaerolineae bacterium]|nr:flavodoxin family protein [Anaerolineae bacterium]
MKKVTVFVASGRKGHTYDAAAQFLRNLQSLGDIKGEIVRLSDYQLRPCMGCQVCFAKGEEYCPLKDDRDALIEKMMASDGVVFATPNYSFHVSALLKMFLDRLGFAFHRPRFFGKTFTGIVAQGIYGGNKIVDYLNFVGNALGFRTVKGSCIMTLDPMTAKQQHKIDVALAAQARRYDAKLKQLGNPAPSLMDLMFFRMGRTKVRLELDDSACDYQYYRDKGWFESDFYYPTRLGFLKKGAGGFFDAMFARMTKAR